MTRKDLFLAIVTSGAALIPGGTDVKEGVQALLNRNDDPSDDLKEVSDAVGKIAVGAVLAAEGLTESDFVDNAVFAQLVENIKGDIKLLSVLVAHKA